jgi:hypothetical protein
MRREFEFSDQVDALTLNRRDSAEMANQHHLPHEGEQESRALTPRDLFIKDAFLVFRALCKLTMKPLNTDRYIKCTACS